MTDSWFVYVLRCADQSLYTGVTTDPARRLDEHNGLDGSQKGARYTRHRRPVVLVYQENCADRRSACQREYAIKQLSKSAKEKLILTPNRTLSRSERESAQIHITP